MASSNRCSVCPKGPGTFYCPGCNAYFCNKDFRIHRETLIGGLDELIADRNELYEKINKNSSQKRSDNSLLARIDAWQEKTILKVKEAADQARQQALKIINSKQEEIDKQFQILSKDLEQLRETEDVLEGDLSRLKNQIEKLHKSLEKLSQPPTAELNIKQSEQITWDRMIYVENQPVPPIPNQPLPHVPLRAPAINIHPNARWQQNGLTVVGGNGSGNGNNQFLSPCGLYINDDDDQTIYIADTWNHRIMEWKWNATSGQVVAGGNGPGDQAHQLSNPFDVIVDENRDHLIICDGGNRRVVRWPRRNGTSGETIISNIYCFGLTMDENGSLYISDREKHEVRRYRRGESQGTVVAGGNGCGNRLDQLSDPRYVFVDRDHSVYVSEYVNHRVMKWIEGAKEGIVVAGGQDKGNSLRQFSCPGGVVVDQLGTVYVADNKNARIMRWVKGATEGDIIVGGNGRGKQSNELRLPIDLSFDRHGNLYVVDASNCRVQKFDIDQNA